MGLAQWWTNQQWLRKVDLMATLEQFSAALAAIDAATNDLAAEVARLREIIAGGGLSPADEEIVLASLADIEAKLKAIAAQPV
jgi:hypothetical protein